MLIKLLKFFFKDKIGEALYNDSIYEVMRFRQFTIILGVKRLANEVDKVLWRITPYETPFMSLMMNKKFSGKFEWDDVN